MTSPGARRWAVAVEENRCVAVSNASGSRVYYNGLAGSSLRCQGRTAEGQVGSSRSSLVRSSQGGDIKPQRSWQGSEAPMTTVVRPVDS